MDMLLKPPEDLRTPWRLLRVLLILMAVLCGDFTAGEDGEGRVVVELCLCISLSFGFCFIDRSGCGVIGKLCGSPMWVNQSDTCHLFSHLPSLF